MPPRLQGPQGDVSGAARAGGLSLHADRDLEPYQCYRLKTPYRDGTIHIVLDSLVLIARVAGLVPPPRVHLTRLAVTLGRGRSPGIGFAPTVRPRGSFAWEQGLPDYFRNRSDGVTDELYSASSRARFGAADRWEIQGAVPLFARLEIDGPDGDSSVSGIGDLAVAAKVQLTSGDGPFNAGLLGTVVFPTGKEELSLGTELYSLGGSMG